ncbi:hypothetical protein GCM10022226_34310 [Sphaerisporangium flaviroseum]|uniref:ATP-grasp domain-containing protein n=1 Tax=Sphaerisporangium flaviroseum TaxID=509199 RepID=A0ABP7I796_9ACTN
MKIAYVTFDGPDDDREVLLASWARAGIDGAAVRWDDPAADWASFEAAVVRSTWDYLDRRKEFVDWAYKAESVTRLLNPAAVLERNTDKTYLRELAEAGVPTVPTHWISPGEGPDNGLDLPTWDDYVVKPAISAGARDAVRTTDRAEAEVHAKRLVAKGQIAMVQPYLHMVEDEGETSLIYFGGRFSHAVRRNAMLADGVAGPPTANLVVQLRDPAPDQLEVAEHVLSTVSEELLYARVDLVRVPDGTPVLIELELTEPYCYLAHASGAAARFTTALRDLL